MSRHFFLPALGIVLAACGGGGADLATIPTTVLPTSIAPTTTNTIVDDVPTSGAATSAPAAASTAPGALGLSPDGPWRQVDSAPGITTPGLVYELMPKLWVYLPVTEDVANGITWTFNETDRPLIEAYLHAQRTYYEAISSNPMDLEGSDWQLYFADGGSTYRASLEARQRDGQFADLDAGVVLRPQVLGDQRTDLEGVVLDCVLDGGVFRMPDGSLAEGSTFGVVPYGVGMRVAVRDDRWIVTQVGSQDDAC
jgi:hypothetical protein